MYYFNYIIFIVSSWLVSGSSILFDEFESFDEFELFDESDFLFSVFSWLLSSGFVTVFNWRLLTASSILWIIALISVREVSWFNIWLAVSNTDFKLL